MNRLLFLPLMLAALTAQAQELSIGQACTQYRTAAYTLRQSHNVPFPISAAALGSTKEVASLCNAVDPKGDVKKVMAATARVAQAADPFVRSLPRTAWEVV